MLISAVGELCCKVVLLDFTCIVVAYRCWSLFNFVVVCVMCVCFNVFFRGNSNFPFMSITVNT